MGLYSVVLVAHNGLDYIAADSNFGQKVVSAIHNAQGCGNSAIHASDGQHSTNVGQVIGRCFHHSYPHVVVFQGGQGWIPDGKAKPKWSSLTKQMVNRLFGKEVFSNKP